VIHVSHFNVMTRLSFQVSVTKLKWFLTLQPEFIFSHVTKVPTDISVKWFKCQFTFAACSYFSYVDELSACTSAASFKCLLAFHSYDPSVCSYFNHVTQGDVSMFKIPACLFIVKWLINCLDYNFAVRVCFNSHMSQVTYVADMWSKYHCEASGYSAPGRITPLSS